MAGNRQHGYLRGNRGGFKGQPWFCDGCQKLHPFRQDRNETLDGRSLCDRQDQKEMAARAKAARAGRSAARAEPGA